MSCPNYHALSPFQVPSNSFYCDGCRQRASLYDTMYGCRPCDYDLCTACYSRKTGKGKGNSSNHAPPQQQSAFPTHAMHRFNDIGTIYTKPKQYIEHKQEQKPKQNMTSGLKTRDVQFCMQYLCGIFDKYCSHGAPNAFDINKHIFIHGGACRDAINRKPIKDIDLSVDLHTIHQHAMTCHNQSCHLARNFKTKFNCYKQIASKPKESDRLNAFLTSTEIINTGWLINVLRSDKSFKKHCSSTKGPNMRSKTLVTYQIYFKNGIDFDIMDCSCFLYWDRHGTGKFSITPQMKVTHIGKGYHENFEKGTLYYPITHEEHAKRTDCLFNALYIPMRSVLNVRLEDWGKYVIDPYVDMTERVLAFHTQWIDHKSEHSAIHDLKKGIIRPFYSPKGNYLQQMMEHLAGDGQAEFIIFRTIKNAYKLKGRQVIYIHQAMRESAIVTYREWFVPEMLIKQNKLKDVLRHAFHHNYFQKVDQNTILGVYHLMCYDGQLLWWYNNHNKFRKSVDAAVKQYKAHTLWNGIKRNASKRMEFYFDGAFDGHLGPQSIRFSDVTFQIIHQ